MVLVRSLPLGVAGLVVALLAVAASLGGRALGGILVMLAVLVVADPLERLHDRWPTTIALAATVIAPTLFLGSRGWLLRPVRNLVLVAGLGFAALWALTRLVYVPAHEALDSVRASIAFYSFLAAAGVELVRTLRQPDLPPAAPFRLVDALFLGVSGGVVGALFLVRGPDFSTLTVAALALLLYPRVRRLTLRAADRLFLSDLRERAAIESAEEERARLARDIHDTSLQELAGVIGQLQSRPDTDAESEALRRVADQLRKMSTELRPPVLDDLGLGAALEFVADRTRRDGVEVTTTIDDQAGIERDTRAPASVELAVFRIVEQALSNVLLHSGATRVTIAGTVAGEHVEVTVHDDGHGISRADLEEAARRGRLGLASMRRRAELIGAKLDVDGAPERGTTVSVSWSR
jgi:signal transduction histidine kinase